ncbi:hypothetical protein D1007_29899 [Hordeum vulgare]|nr:hypothetical protein D1007_29899 [Hordeum vulgare]
MCTEPTSLAVLMAKADKYAMADSAMRVKVTASDKVVPTPATPKPAGDNRGSQNNYKRKADQMDPRSNSKLVASVEGETSAPQAGPPRKHPNKSKTNWLPKQSFEQLLDAPCKIHSGRSRLPTPFDSAALCAGCRKGMACRLLRVRMRPHVHQLPTTLRFRRRRLATTAITKTTTLIKTERSAVGSVSYVGCGSHAGCADYANSKSGTD